MSELQDTARKLFQAAVDRADPARALARSLDEEPLPAPGPGGRNLILAVGKAAVPMMREALRHIPGPRAALAITNPENTAEIEGAEVLAGAHPVPDETSAAAGQAVIRFLSDTTAADRVTALISGGGSALMVAPAPGLTWEDKAEVNRLLLGAGLEIGAMNLVRQQLSALKGGGLLRHAAPAPVTACLLSDVIGDDPRAIASGPAAEPIGTRKGARDLLADAGLWDKVPEAVRRHLSQDVPPPELPKADNRLIGSNRHSLEAMCDAAEGWEAHIVDDRLTGDVADAAAAILAAARKAAPDRPVALIFGGETTVQIRGEGRGGRNQELALRIARDGAEHLDGNWLFLSAGTDGRDGPTDAAGGFAGPGTWDAIRKAGEDPGALLDDNDSYRALKAADALLVTGGTGTNVADVQIFLRKP